MDRLPLRPWLVATILVAPLILPLRVNAQGSVTSFRPDSQHTSAVDAKGVRHQDTEYVGNPPWLNDRLKRVDAAYPYEERRHLHQGRGIIRLTLDLKTGVVTKAVVVKSTGFSTLDDCAASAFRQWTWKAAKWKEIDVPFTFKLGNISAPLPR